MEVTQELLRHAAARVTPDTYALAITDKKRSAQTKVVRLLVSGGHERNSIRPQRVCQFVPTKLVRIVYEYRVSLAPRR